MTQGLEFKPSSQAFFAKRPAPISTLGFEFDGFYLGLATVCFNIFMVIGRFSGDWIREEMINKSNGKSTIPQIFFNDYHVGGYQELRELEKENKLQELLK